MGLELLLTDMSSQKQGQGPPDKAGSAGVTAFLLAWNECGPTTALGPCGRPPVPLLDSGKRPPLMPSSWLLPSLGVRSLLGQEMPAHTA